MGDQDQAVQLVEKEFVSIIILLLINSSSSQVPEVHTCTMYLRCTCQGKTDP